MPSVPQSRFRSLCAIRHRRIGNVYEKSNILSGNVAWRAQMRKPSALLSSLTNTSALKQLRLR